MYVYKYIYIYKYVKRSIVAHLERSKTAEDTAEELWFRKPSRSAQ